MSSFWRGTSEEKLNDAEKQVFNLTGLEEDEYSSYPVKFEFPESEWKQQQEENLDETNIAASGWL